MALSTKGKQISLRAGGYTRANTYTWLLGEYISIELDKEGQSIKLQEMQLFGNFIMPCSLIMHSTRHSRIKRLVYRSLKISCEEAHMSSSQPQSATWSTLPCRQFISVYRCAGISSPWPAPSLLHGCHWLGLPPTVTIPHRQFLMDITTEHGTMKSDRNILTWPIFPLICTGQTTRLCPWAKPSHVLQTESSVFGHENADPAGCWFSYKKECRREVTIPKVRENIKKVFKVWPPLQTLGKGSGSVRSPKSKMPSLRGLKMYGQGTCPSQALRYRKR